MAVKEKLDLLNLSADELQKANKFLATLAFVTEEEIKANLNYLSSLGIRISKANQMKVITNSEAEIAKKVDILSGIHELDIYRKNPNAINLNVIDLYKRIQYCKQNNIFYKKEDGNYETFLFSEMLWQKHFNKAVVVEDITPQDELITFEQPADPVVEPIIPVVDSMNGLDKDHIDIKEFMETNSAKETEKTTDFASIREGLEALKGQLDEISFSDINLDEDYRMGRAA